MNNSIEYFCESAPMLSDRLPWPLLQPPLHSLRLPAWGNGAALKGRIGTNGCQKSMVLISSETHCSGC
ncbi:hypothetical protein H6G97_50265 [Nostoc flagelliforme FACHB-838]|uniref:Uncharacterized protein n=1 Tax=Nostoc flagelliforme FACHB-838 TaxID=2692904 RepID=A0ABR8E5K5_9NOSO|nr:hypothetical protein [Nostoc flagelliforme FACHB-838]